MLTVAGAFDGRSAVQTGTSARAEGAFTGHGDGWRRPDYRPYGAEGIYRGTLPLHGVAAFDIDVGCASAGGARGYAARNFRLLTPPGWSGGLMGLTVKVVVPAAQSPLRSPLRPGEGVAVAAPVAGPLPRCFARASSTRCQSRSTPARWRVRHRRRGRFPPSTTQARRCSCRASSLPALCHTHKRVQARARARTRARVPVVRVRGAWQPSAPATPRRA